MNKSKAYVIVSRDQKSIFGRSDEEFFGATWFYPTKEVADDHCGPAGEVIEIEVAFPDEISFLLFKGKKMGDYSLCKSSRGELLSTLHLVYGILDSVIHAADVEKSIKTWIPDAMKYLRPHVIKQPVEDGA